MEQRQREWDKLEMQAMFLLEHPHLLPEQKGLGKFHLALRLWHYPAFEPYTIWLVYRGVRDEKSYLLREVVWDRSDEAERMLNPLEGLKRGFHTTPTFRIRTVELVKDEVDSRLTGLQHISLPVFTKRKYFVIADGDIFGIAVSGLFLNAQISWWCDGQEEWQEVIAWFNHMKAYFLAQLEQNSTRD